MLVHSIEIASAIVLAGIFGLCAYGMREQYTDRSESAAPVSAPQPVVSVQEYDPELFARWRLGEIPAGYVPPKET